MRTDTKISLSFNLMEYLILLDSLLVEKRHLYSTHKKYFRWKSYRHTEHGEKHVEIFFKRLGNLYMSQKKALRYKNLKIMSRKKNDKERVIKFSHGMTTVKGQLETLDRDYRLGPTFHFSTRMKATTRTCEKLLLLSIFISS